MKILIVDDIKENIYLSEATLKGAGHDIVSATNGVEALEKLRAEGFDMIVSDILMPVMDGFQLCRECKGDEKLKHIPFVFHTAEYAEEEDENLALKLGVDRFIRKPIESDEFIKLIQGVFRDLEEAKKKPIAAGMTILVVEDNEDSRNLLVKQLRAYGHEVTPTANGAEALEQALVQPPDIIVSDILMPKMDGYQLCHECKQNDKLKDIPFVFYTATYTREEDEKFALSLGADTFLAKPTEPDILVQMLSEVFEKAKAGALAAPEVALLEPSLFLAEHEKRIFAKLEDKVAQLEAEIAQRKLAEEELQLAEQNFRNSLDSSPLGIRIVTADGELLYANQAILDICGCSSVEELKATPLRKRYTPESYAEHQERVQRRKLGKPVPSNYEISIVRKDGEIRHLVASRKAVVWGSETQFQTLYQDITERKLAEENIKQAAEEWRTTFDSIADLVSIHDKDFRLVRVNKAFADALKMKPEELIGKTCYQVIHGTNDPVPNCPHMKTLKTKKTAIGEFFAPHLGIHLEVATSPIFDGKGEVVASVHVARDISERKKMEEQLIVTDRLASIGELSSGIAHELNNPLTSVIGFSELLLGKDVPDDVKEDLEVINREAKRTAGVVRNLLIFARKHPEEKEAVDINKAIQAVLELRAYEQKVNNIEVNTQFAPDLPEITANAFDLQQAFLNIIINAEHFMIEANGRGTLTITTERVGDIIRASFADDGPGIAKENLGHLFDPFFTTKEVGKGTGLGLSICHGIVTGHGGRIYAESEPGKGATFVVELPISK